MIPITGHAKHIDPGTVNKMQLQFHLPLIITFSTPDENSDSSHGFCSHSLLHNPTFYNLCKSKTVSGQYVERPLKKSELGLSPSLLLSPPRFASGWKPRVVALPSNCPGQDFLSLNSCSE